MCGCPFSLPLIRNPENPDPNEDEMLALNDPYDSRVLPRELTKWLTDFRVVGRWRNPHPLFKNVSSIPDFFMSPPARWQYGYTLDPAIPTTEGKEEKLSVYESTDAENGMLFPIHQACLNLVDLMCETRKERCQVGNTRQPQTLEEFCDSLELRRSSNLNDSRKIMENHYYGNSGGIEWSHQYFGARQFWTDEWDTSPGWELLCADPALMKIPGLSSFILSELPLQSNPSQKLVGHEPEAEFEIEWLFPQEMEATRQLEQGRHDWAKGISSLKLKANSIGADVGAEPRKGKLMSSVPLGLKNRWRIWKVLEHIDEE